MDLRKLLTDKIQKQLDSWNAEIDASEAKAKARYAQAEAEAADAELEKELWARVNELKKKVQSGREYLDDLKDAGAEKTEQIKRKVSDFLG